MKYHDFEAEVLGTHCRECINRIYGLTLEREACGYLIYPERCECCGNIRNIVAAVAPLNRWKIWMVKAPNREEKQDS